MAASRNPARAEVVGSLLRPAALRDAASAGRPPGRRVAAGEAPPRQRSALAALEDEAIAGVVRRQISLGLDVVSDGELRRSMFLDSFYGAVDGVSPDGGEVEFTNERGETAVLAVHRVERRLRRVGSPAAREAAYLASITDHPFKVTFPAASLFVHPLGVSPGAYADAEERVAHAIAIERELIADAVAAGCRYVQLDFPLYPYLVDERHAARFRAAGHDPERLLDRALDADRAVLDGLPPGVTRALHVCRGNYRSRWLCAGSLEPVAERLFGELPYDVFLVEWDDLGRDGGYAPIRHLPRGRTMVMGLVTSKRPELESEDDVLRRLDDASRHLPVDQLAVSTQCGFASVADGNELDEDAQWAKLELVARVADRVWPR